jgi:hypothetical protein
MKTQSCRLRPARWAAALLAVAALSLPAADEVPQTAPTRPKSYRVIRDARVKLECISSHRVFTAGEDATLTFRLKNASNKPLLIYEWFRAENDNLILHYAQELDDPTLGSDDASWLTIKPEANFEAPRMPLELAPGNAVLVNRTLPFVRDIDPKDLTAPRNYLLYSELNLSSLSAKSPVILITVQP